MMWRLKRATMVAVVACSVGGCYCNRFLFYWSLALLVVVAAAFFFVVQRLAARPSCHPMREVNPPVHKCPCICEVAPVRVAVAKKVRESLAQTVRNMPLKARDRTAGPIADKPGFVVDACKSDLLKANFMSSLGVFFLPSSISFPLSISLSRRTSLSLYVKPLSQPSSFSFSRQAAEALSQPLSHHHASRYPICWNKAGLHEVILGTSAAKSAHYPSTESSLCKKRLLQIFLSLRHECPAKILVNQISYQEIKSSLAMKDKELNSFAPLFMSEMMPIFALSASLLT
ncbi:unnamed protein product [Prunus brigantina]